MGEKLAGPAAQGIRAWMAIDLGNVAAAEAPTFGVRDETAGCQIGRKGRNPISGWISAD